MALGFPATVNWPGLAETRFSWSPWGSGQSSTDWLMPRFRRCLPPPCNMFSTAVFNSLPGFEVGGFPSRAIYFKCLEVSVAVCVVPSEVESSWQKAGVRACTSPAAGTALPAPGGSFWYSQGGMVLCSFPEFILQSSSGVILRRGSPVCSRQWDSPGPTTFFFLFIATVVTKFLRVH